MTSFPQEYRWLELPVTISGTVSNLLCFFRLFGLSVVLSLSLSLSVTHTHCCLQFGNAFVVHSKALIDKAGLPRVWLRCCALSGTAEPQGLGTRSAPVEQPACDSHPHPLCCSVVAPALPAGAELFSQKGQGKSLLYSSLSLGSQSGSCESFVYICKLSEFDMEVTKGEYIWNIEMPFLQAHF